MEMDARKRNEQGKRGRNAMASGRGYPAGGAQFTNGYRTAGGPDYRSSDGQTSDHPRGKRGIGHT